MGGVLLLVQWLGAIAVAAGLGFCGLGVIGLLRMPDVYTRMHAASKVITLGSSLTLLGVALLSPLDVALKAVGTLVFLFLTTPIATFAVARTAHGRGELMARATVIDELARDEARAREEGGGEARGGEAEGKEAR